MRTRLRLPVVQSLPGVSLAAICLLFFTVTAFASTHGLLRVDPRNPRYFVDGSGRAVYLTGSHTWPVLIDRSENNPPGWFDFDYYLRIVERSHHNFIRLWSRHVSRYTAYGKYTLYSSPLPWQRSGGGTALDGKSKFNLKEFEPEYFARLYERVAAADVRGIYVSIMFFGGVVEMNEWAGNPFNASNNINGINGDPNGDGQGDTHVLPLPRGVKAIQKAYIRRVIDTVNEFDNVLYEVSNEGLPNSASWQYDVIRYVKDYEAGRIDGVVRKRHPVGMTTTYDPGNVAIAHSPADWVSPGAALFDDTRDPFIGDPPVADGSKVSILDSDHLFFARLLGNAQLGRSWVWKSFLRGHHPILMENLPGDSTAEAVAPTLNDPGYTAARLAMGYTRMFAERMNLAAMLPRPDLATGYVLANEGHEYLIYQPGSGPLYLPLPAGTYHYQWFNPATADLRDGTIKVEGGRQMFTPPYTGDAVLYIRALG
jgi:hypothetical protein